MSSGSDSVLLEAIVCKVAWHRVTLALARQAHRVVLSFDLLHLTGTAFSACACAAVLY